jgi:hypothetical protein
MDLKPVGIHERNTTVPRHFQLHQISSVAKAAADSSPLCVRDQHNPSLAEAVAGYKSLNTRSPKAVLRRLQLVMKSKLGEDRV